MFVCEDVSADPPVWQQAQRQYIEYGYTDANGEWHTAFTAEEFEGRMATADSSWLWGELDDGDGNA